MIPHTVISSLSAPYMTAIQSPKHKCRKQLRNAAHLPKHRHIRHGTHVAGIAAGNGNGNEQNTKYRGVAYESTLIIVKLKTSGGASFPTTTQIMLAVDFCIRKSIDMNMPIAINLSFGTSNGSHSAPHCLNHTWTI